MAKSPTTLSLETGMLSFERSIQITEGLFVATKSSDPGVRTPVEILEKGVRGQTANDLKQQDHAKAGNSNVQSIEYAVVPQGHDGVALSFSARFMPFSLRPHACNNLAVRKAYCRLAQGYRAAGGYHTLARLFIWNIANARFAWRNRFQADTMTVTLAFNEADLQFDPFRLGLDAPDDMEGLRGALLQGTNEGLLALIEGVVHGLSNDNGQAFQVKVTWNATMAPGQEIFPSQEYLRDEKKDEKLSRALAKLPTFHAGRTLMQASMHSQKIGAALRHIDIWHGSAEHEAPIAINPYGGVQETGAVLRAPKTGISFYDIRAKADRLIEGVESAQTADDLSPEVHFVMANLIRGGVFGSTKKKAEVNG